MRDNTAEIHALKSQAQELLSRNELAPARGLYERICALGPDDAESWFILGAIHGSLGGFGEAIACCRRTLVLRPDHVGAHYNLAQACMHLNKLEEAVAHFRHAVKLRPDYADAWNNLGNALHDLRRYDEARISYQEALRLRPDLTGTRYRLASLGGAPLPDKPPPEYVEKLFDSYAGRFEQQLVGQLQYRTPELLNGLIRRSLPTAPRSLDMLDLGCGTGLCGPLFRDVARTLVGVDLSARMIDKAREKKVYDKLVVGDITDPAFSLNRFFDLVVAADVFPYVGDLSSVFRACHDILTSGGHFAFSVEALDDMDQSYALRPTDRYAHAPAYIRKLIPENGFTELGMDNVVLRMDRGKPVAGRLFLLRRST